MKFKIMVNVNTVTEKLGTYLNLNVAWILKIDFQPMARMLSYIFKLPKKSYGF